MDFSYKQQWEKLHSWQSMQTDSLQYVLKFSVPLGSYSAMTSAEVKSGMNIAKLYSCTVYLLFAWYSPVICVIVTS